MLVDLPMREMPTSLGYDGISSRSAVSVSAALPSMTPILLSSEEAPAPLA